MRFKTTPGKLFSVMMAIATLFFIFFWAVEVSWIGLILLMAVIAHRIWEIWRDIQEQDRDAPVEDDDDDDDSGKPIEVDVKLT